MGKVGGDGVWRVNFIFQCRGQSDPGAIWVWDSMNVGSQLPDGACGARWGLEVLLGGSNVVGVWLQGKEPLTLPTVDRKFNSIDSGVVESC